MLNSLLQERILSDVANVDRRQACSLMGLSGVECSAAMEEKVVSGEVLQFTVDGDPVYPLFQFDMAGQRVYPAMMRIISAKPPSWSDYRMLHWMTTYHLGLGQRPADGLASNADAVWSAFQQEIQIPSHG